MEEKELTNKHFLSFVPILYTNISLRIPPSHTDDGSVGGSGARAVGVVPPVEQREGGPDDIHAAQAKRKLYFNPAYFEPEMLQAPPPAAIEFLTRIREMITIAKSKMKLERSTASSSRMTVAMDDLHDVGDGEAVYASDHSIQSDSLERRPREDDSRSSTLKKLAKRVNSHGQSIVSEIIRTLDLKPRLPAPVESVYVAHTPPRRPTAPKPPPPKPVNAREEAPLENDDDFPELIKPSMLRSVLRDGKRLTDLNNTFENFRQEMMATFNKMKKVGEAISPKSTLQRVKNRNKAEASPVGTLEKGKAQVTSSEGKVQKWLQTLENKNMYSRMSETSNVVFDSRKAMPRSNSPPPLPQKGSKPPTPPRKNRAPAQRSISFNEAKEPTLPSPEEAGHSKGTSKARSPGNSTQVTRSLSWQNEHRHYDSNPRRSRQQMHLMPEDSLNTSFGSEDDSLNDLLSEAEAKVPKMIPSDSDSVYSDTKPRSKEKKASHKEEIDTNSKSLSRQLPREEEITERNEIFNKNTGAKTMSRLAKNGDNIYEERNNNSLTSEDYDDHTYEEIQFPNNGKQKRRAPPKPKNNNVSEVHIDNNNDDDDGHYSIYSNPESLVSEVTILGEEKCSSPIYSGCKVTIPVTDNGNGNTDDKDNGFDQDTLERRGKKAERSNSIVQDSLERPKVKKRTFANHENSLERTKAQRRLSFPGDKNRGDKSLLDIYESRSSIRSLRSFKSDMHDPSYSPITFSNPSSPTKTESFYFKNISNNTNLGVIKNSEPPKKLRTFKDYQEMNFHRGSSDSSETSSSPLPVTGSSISVNFRSTSPSNKEHRELKPPLPPKQTRPTDPGENASPGLPPKNRIARPPLPLKASRRSDSSDSEPERPKLPEKSRKKASLETLSRSSSGSSIPELTEEEARSILHGLLAHTQPDVNRLSPLHEEDDNDGHFLGVRNTVADSNTRPSVPYYETFSSGSQNSLTPTSSSSSPRSDDIEETGSNTLGREVEHSLDRQLLRRQDSSCEPGSPGSEARVSGEFILSTTGKSPSLRRQSSLSREQTSGFLAKLRDITDDDVDGETLTKGMEIALALKAKSDLEKHFKEKSGADSIKRTWRKIIEKVDDSKEDKDKISIMKFQQYMASLERKEKEAKLKQEDSGYHSTDSSESANSKNSLASTASLGESPLAAPPELPFQIGTGNRPVRSLSYTSSLQRPLFQRSMSLQQLGRSSSQLELSPRYETGSFKRASMRASLGRRHQGAEMDGLSIYVNNSFAADDDGDHGNVAL
ncbi:LOW QUALITY PROTEIN: uncharacterized protein LOC119579615 [Penaeus monodon]|uniref:LOW QUALITY PROTEIN: uncharacterized protein LOC119579615 n=1 Tax=Penaeus monodon TaxID=6687 RepID=UPI0018A77A3A|nr:LOW QUALITY PROTEIN: uncharacterized protein LOC119579615 [Penaeus monodon]